MRRMLLSFLGREKAPVVLVLASLGLVAWQHWGMNTSKVFDPSQTRIRLVHKDDHSDGGNSVCTVSVEEGMWKFRYDIRPGVSWAFCGMNISNLGSDSSGGIDLSGYSTAVVDIAEFGGTNKSLQMTLKTMDPAVYKEGDNVSLKYQTLEFFPPRDSVSRSTMPFNSFSIPSWWVSRYRVPVEHLDRDRHDVREIEFLTSSGLAVIGSGTIGIRRIELHGKWITREHLLQLILGTILVYVFGSLAYRLFRSMRTERLLRQRQERLQELANIDPLTGALNRRGLDAALCGLRLRANQAKDHSLGVLMLDLDHFKSVNDTWGHDAGDAVLAKTTAVIREFLRDDNLLSRWGGEEFLVVIADIPIDRLRLLAEKIRQKVEREVRWENRSVTVSIGLSHGRMERFADLAKFADEALYEAKEHGRNQVRESTCIAAADLRHPTP